MDLCTRQIHIKAKRGITDKVVMERAIARWIRMWGMGTTIVEEHHEVKVCRESCSCASKGNCRSDQLGGEFRGIPEMGRNTGNRRGERHRKKGRRWAALTDPDVRLMQGGAAEVDEFGERDVNGMGMTQLQLTASLLPNTVPFPRGVGTCRFSGCPRRLGWGSGSLVEPVRLVLRGAVESR